MSTFVLCDSGCGSDGGTLSEAGAASGSSEGGTPPADGPDRRGYLNVLGRWLSDLGGVVEEGPAGASATLDGRRIAIRFGPVSGHR